MGWFRKDRAPVAEVIPNKLLPEEVEAIFEYALEHPEQHHREIQFNLERQDLAVVPASSVLRELQKAGLVKEHKWHKPRKRWKRPEATAAHQHWLVDITYIPVKEGFWYLIAIIDLYSRYIVGWELSPTSTARDVERTIDFALAEWRFHET